MPLSQILLQALMTLAIAVVTTLLTIRLSQRKFRAERLWDRKAAAYERLIDAFHKSKRFDEEHLDALHRGREVDHQREEDLRRLSKEANEEIERTADIGSFTISPQCLEIIKAYLRDSRDTDHISAWHDYLDHDYDITSKALQAVIQEATRDLHH